MATDYKIISAKSTAELEKLVKAEIAKGWQPQGGVETAIIGSKGISMQAVVKT